MSVRLATPADVPAVLTMAEVFVASSDYGMEFDREQAESYLRMMLNQPRALVMVADDVSAGMIATISHDWCKRPVCYVEKMFLLPSSRGTGVARSLVAAAVEFARQYDCSHVFASATAGMGETVAAMFCNLFRKFGFSGCGQILVRSM